MYVIVFNPIYIIDNPDTVESVVIPNNSYNDEEDARVSFRNMPRLKRIVIGDECLEKVRLFEIDGVNELESVVIGENSFTYCKSYNNIETSARNDGSYRVVNCPNLTTLKIGDFTFADYRMFEFYNLPSLHTIEMGESCFHWAAFYLTGMINE